MGLVVLPQCVDPGCILSSLVGFIVVWVREVLTVGKCVREGRGLRQW